MKQEVEFKGHRSLFTVLLIMILANPFLYQRSGLDWVGGLIFLFMLLASVMTIVGQSRHFWFLIGLAVLSLIGEFGLLAYESGILQGLRNFASAALIFWISALLLRNVIVRSTEVTPDLIYGAVNIYILLGLGFAFVYAFFHHLDPASFRGFDDVTQYSDLIHPFVYYSFITMTSLGYGDIAPLTPYVRTLAWVQAAMGQLFLVILVARLVGLYVVRSR